MKWISVKEKLPEKCHTQDSFEYHVVLGGDEKDEDYIRIALFFKADEHHPEDNWWHVGPEGKMDGVTHWITLPTLPKEDE